MTTPQPQPGGPAGPTEIETGREEGAPRGADPTRSPEGTWINPELETKEVHRGGRPGEKYIRRVRTGRGLIRRRGPGLLIATEKALEPRGRVGRFLNRAKRFLIGRPLTTADIVHERLSKVKALAVLSSDAVSSSAYATEEILRVLVLAGAAALTLTIPISIAIAILLFIVGTSYRQTIKAYPQGGGSYIVTKDNLGTIPSLVAGAALMIDYVLTVAVSISAGVAAITSALPQLLPLTVELAVSFLALITIVNLRGVRESGTIFAAPTYLFIFSMLGVIGLGAYRALTGSLEPVTEPTVLESLPVAEPLTLFLVLRAFASGCAALTGTEAISDGVPAFKPPEWKNARVTLTWMVVILAVLFVGISSLASFLHVLPKEDETVPSQVARTVLGGEGPFYFVVQISTMLILILAANTSFSDFPRLSYFLARDGFLPHQFYFRGDRLAFSTGIMALALVSGLLIVGFGADTHALIPLYAVGVFVSFTLSQSGMVVRWWRRREEGWQHGLPINALGAVTTGLVAIIIGTTKFEHGAWMVIVLLPVLVILMLGIHSHYQSVAEQIALDNLDKPLPEIPEPPIVVPVPGLNLMVVRTLAFARSLSKNVTAVYVTDDLEAAQELRAKWDRWAGDVPLVVLESPYRSLTSPLLAYLDALERQHPGTPVTVALGEFVPRHWWEHLLHGQVTLRLKLALFFRPNTVVVDVPFHLKR